MAQPHRILLRGMLYLIEKVIEVIITGLSHCFEAHKKLCNLFSNIFRFLDKVMNILT